MHRLIALLISRLCASTARAKQHIFVIFTILEKLFFGSFETRFFLYFGEFLKLFSDGFAGRPATVFFGLRDMPFQTYSGHTAKAATSYSGDPASYLKIMVADFLKFGYGYL